MLLADSDNDGDICCVTNQKEIIDGAYGGLPVAYENKKAPKSKIIESELYLADMSGFNSKVGFLTNLSTTMYAMLPLFSEDSLEYTEIIRRLKQCRKEQGSIIDSAKGLILRPIPKHWSNWSRITDKMSEEEINRVNFNNSILISKRPQFMINLYSSYGKEYRKYCNDWNSRCIGNFNLELKDLLNFDRDLLSTEQKEFVDKFYRWNPLLDSACEINNISKHMQNKIKEIKSNSKSTWSKDIIEPMKKHEVDKWDDNKSDALIALHEKYKSGKRNFRNIKDESGEIRYQTIDQYNKAIRQEALKLSSDLGELAYYAISRCYVSLESDNKEFVWAILGQGVVDNLINNFKNKKIEIPFLDENGDIEYLGKRYSRREIKIVADDIYDFL